MADVFISYSTHDRSRVEPLAHAIKDRGWSVFWDPKLRQGKQWQTRFQEELDNARCVLVVWSSNAVNSNWMLNEAASAKSRKLLLPVMIEPVKLPRPFDGHVIAQLFDRELGPHSELEKVLSAIEKIIGESAPGTLSGQSKSKRKKIKRQKQEGNIKPRDDDSSKKAAIESGQDDIAARTRHNFTELLNNKDKKRGKGFIALVNGGPDLTPLEEACFDSNQTWNRCITLRYTLRGKTYAGALPGLFEAFLGDLRKLAEGNTTAGYLQPDESIIRKYAEQTIKGLSSVESLSEQSAIALRILNEIIETGIRLVLFGEFPDLGGATSLKDLGMAGDVLDTFANIPERLCLVLSGIPDAMVAISPEGPLLAEPPPSTGPPIYVFQLDSVPIANVDVHAQAFTNDIPRGPDRLHIVHEVNAIAETIALKKMKPPLVVGILGGWGWGKSFVLHLLEERLRDIRCESMPPPAGNPRKKGGGESFPYVGHIYVIRFDAWTYSKSSLWSSLMQTILLEFNRQLGIEQITRKYAGDEPQVWRLLMELGQRQVQEIRESPLRDKAIEAAIKFREENQKIEGLWNRFENLRTNERNKLKQSEALLAAKRNQLEKARVELESKVDEQLERMINQKAWMPVWEELLAAVGGKIDERLKKEGAEMPSLRNIKRLLGFRRGLGRGLNMQTAVFLLFAIISGIGLWLFNSDTVAKYISATVAILSSFGGILQVVRKSQQWVENKFNDYQSHVNALRDRMEERRDAIRRRILAGQIEVYAKALKNNDNSGSTKTPPPPVTELEHEVRAAEAEAAEHRRNVGFTANYSSLLDFVKGRIDSGFYDEKLGLLHQVQKDLQDLTDAILAEQDGQDNLFPRGKPRIVLVVDDLDRCPPPRVVEVLEAAQLLVKTRLFVIVMALDVRYITRALEKEYSHVLIRNGEPSGLDYIEKIIQVPYRVRAIQGEAMSGYLRPQMDIEKKVKQKSKVSAIGSSIPPVPEPKTAEPVAKPEEKAYMPGPSESIHDPDTMVPEETQPVPRTIVKFLEEEFELLADCCNKVIVSPRATKRLINVFKLLKIIWNRRNLGHGPSADVKRVMLVLLALSTRFPVVLRVLLRALEDEYRKSPGGANQISTFLIELCKKEKKDSIHSGGWTSVCGLISDDEVFPKKIRFKDVSVENIRLIVSFSFVGETDPKRERPLEKGMAI